MKLKLSDWAGIAEIVGAFAIVITLVYLASQTRQLAIQTELNTQSQNAAILQTMAQDLWQINQTMPYELRLKVLNGEQLTFLEFLEYVNWIGPTMRTYESWWRQHQLGIIDDETFESYISHMDFTMGYQFARDWWPDRGYEVHPEFEKYVSDLIARNPLDE